MSTGRYNTEYRRSRSSTGSRPIYLFLLIVSSAPIANTNSSNTDETSTIISLEARSTSTSLSSIIRPSQKYVTKSIRKSLRPSITSPSISQRIVRNSTPPSGQATQPLDFHSTGSTSCPRSCECFNNGETVDCSRADLLEVPALTNTTKRLYLEDNLVNHLSRDSFRSAPNLCLLVLERNELTTISAEALCDLPGLQELELAGNRLRSFNIDDSGLCIVPNLKELDVSLNLLRAVPERLSVFAPNLEILNLAYNEIESFRFDSTYAKLKSLKYLDMSRNRVHEISSADFQPLSFIALEILNLAECGLTKIESGALAQLGNLTSLSLSGNPLSHEQLTPVLEAFRTNNTLARLDISEITMPNLTVHTLGSFEKLVILDAAYCDVEYFDPKLFSTFSENLETLHLEGGRLKQLENVVALRKLRRLHLQENHLSGIDIHGLETLESLDLSYNQIEIIHPHWLHSIPNLQVLNLSHNKIKSIHPDALNGLNIISTLDLSYNQLESLHGFGLTGLSRLDISNNLIQEIKNNAFVGLISSLTELNLSNNKLTTLSGMVSQDESGKGGSTDWHYNLRILNLASNHLHNFFKSRRPFEATATLVFRRLPELETLDLSRNGLSNLECDMMHYMPYLTELKLSENNFSSLVDTNVWCISNLARLYLARNSLKVIECKVLTRMTNLESIDLSGNPFLCDCRLISFLRWINETTSTGMLKVEHYSDWASYQCDSPNSLTSAYLFSELTFHRACSMATKQALMALTYGDVVLPSDVIEMAAIVTSVVCVTVLGTSVGFTIMWKRCKIRQRIKVMRYRWQIRYRELSDNTAEGKCFDTARAEILDET